MARPRASVVFRGPALAGGAADHDSDLYRFGDRLATWLLRTLRQLGAGAPPEPGLDGDRWTIDLVVDGERHVFSLEYCASGAEAGTWAGRVTRRRRFPGSLLPGRRHASAAAVGLVRRALAAAPDISAISWHEGR
jgi:hypothetical protein